MKHLVATGIILLSSASALFSQQNRAQQVATDGRSEDSGYVVKYSLNERTEGATDLERALHFLRQNAKDLGVPEKGKGTVVREVSSYESLVGTTIRFVTEFHDVPVYQSERTVTLNRRGEVIFYSGYQQVDSDPGEWSSSFDSEYASLLAINEAGGTVVTSGPIVKRYFTRTHSGGLIPAFEVKFSSFDPSGSWEVLVNAKTGEILRKENRMVSSKPSTSAAADTIILANVFDPDPLTTSGAKYGDPGFIDNNDSDSDKLGEELIQVGIRGVTFQDGLFKLSGPWVEVADIELPSHPAGFNRNDANFQFTRSNDAFEAVNAYYHLDRAFRYVNDTLGVAAVPASLGYARLRFDPHAQGGDDNSAYFNLGFYLVFGDGGVDDAEDAEVIIHEFSHALHDLLTSGSLSNKEGLSEGFADYWAQSYSHRLGSLSPEHPSYHHVFDWDAHNEFTATSRTTDYPYLYPNLTGQIHTDGQIFATCFIGIQEMMDRKMTDRLVLTGLSMLDRGANQNDAAVAIFRASQQLLSQPEWEALHTRVSECGYTLPAISLNAEVVASLEKVRAGSGVQYLINVHNDSLTPLTDVVVTLPIPANTTLTGSTSSCGGSVQAGTLIIPLGTLASGNSRRCELELVTSLSLFSTTFFGDDMELGMQKWTRSTPSGQDWSITSSSSYSGFQSWFAEDVGFISDQIITMTEQTVPLTGSPSLTFWHEYETEGKFDGGVVEISDDAGLTWIDAKDLFLKNGYNIVIDNRYDSPIADRFAFSGQSGGYLQSVVSLADFVGKNIQVRFRFVTDRSVSSLGWWVDDVYVIDATTLQIQACVSTSSGPSTCADIQTLVSVDADPQPAQQILGMEAFPNPFTSVFQLNITGISDEETTVNVFDTLGRRIFSEIVRKGSGRVVIDGSAWANGMYFISTASEQSVFSTAVLKR